MEPFNVRLSSKHRVVVDDLNVTLQEFFEISQKWKPIGYYSTVAGAMNKVATVHGVTKDEYTAMSYAAEVLEQAENMIKEAAK